MTPRWLCALCLTLISWSAGAGDLPDARLTPGAARSDLTLAQICATRWGIDERKVTEAMKRDVLAAYHMTPAQCPSGEIEIDHLWSRELGGADVIANLWPQCYEKTALEWGAHKKDRLENDLGKRVCLPSTNPRYLSLDAARHLLSDNWIAAYIERYGDPTVVDPTH